MNYTQKQRGSLGQLVLTHLIAGGLLAGALGAGTVYAAGEVTQVQTSELDGTPTKYSIDGRTFHWGMGTSQIMEGFTADGQSFQYAGTADRVELIRHDDEGVSTGNPCGVFVERLGATSGILRANYPSDGSDTGNCDMAAMLAGRVVNRGALNLFSNTGDNPKNVERVDYLYDRGVLTPLTSSALALSGHVVAEKSGNNPLQIAAVTEVDFLGQPTAFGPLVFVGRNNSCSGESVCYGVTNLTHNYSFFQNNSFAPQGYPSFLRNSTEPVGMAFVSLEKLGLKAGQVYYGFSYFADDVDPAVHTLTDVSTFPNDTNDEEIVFGDGPDIYGGVAGYYLGIGLSVATGAIFKDENGDEQQGENEAGISDIGLALFQDSNSNGVFDPNDDAQLGPMFNTDVNGVFHIPGLEDGVYFLQVDESDADMPPALNLVPGSNPAMLVIQGNDADGINFGFISDTGPTADTDAGGVDAGSSDAGNADAGASDAGDADAGVSDAGIADAGASDAGVADAGASDAGNADVGVSVPGEVDAGATDTGATDGGQQADGANATVANPDSASVNQGSNMALIEVLTNDTDASGDGLTIVSTTEPPNGTVEIIENQIFYTPDFGYIGMDNFLYTIEDGAGTQSTGTVSVDVLKFADLNKNGLNDYVECNCDSLTIEVGLEGSALGGTSFISFLILTFMVGVRRVFRTRRGTALGAGI